MGVCMSDRLTELKAKSYDVIVQIEKLKLILGRIRQEIDKAQAEERQEQADANLLDERKGKTELP